MPSPSVPVIECRNLWKVFGGSPEDVIAFVRKENPDRSEILRRFNAVVGVRDASFSVSEGEIFCIMGLSGSGKSTLIRHINRLVEPSAGQVLVEGVDISRLRPPELRRLRAQKIGMVFQNMALMPHRTVRENVAFSLEVRGVPKAERFATADRMIELVELGGWQNRYPDELSGGMQQRVGLARALAADPHVLLMDEPFSALDPLIRRQLQTEFLRLSVEMRKTTIFITHDLDEAIRIGDRIAIMKEGRFIQTGTAEEIVTAPADDYVADFVAGISRVHLVTAKRLMIPIADYERRNGPLKDAGHPRAAPDDDLDRLGDLSLTIDLPVLVETDGRVIGVVTRAMIIRGMQGRRLDGREIGTHG